jgi:ComF family protein
MRRMAPATLQTQKLGGAIRRLCRASADLLVPASCCLCGAGDVRPARRLCDDCCDRLRAEDARLCPRCACFVNPYTIHGGRCAHCRGAEYRFDSALAIGPYEGELRDTIVRMKQSTEQSLTFAMGQLLGDRAITHLQGDLPDWLVPVPMHWFRRVFRTINSPELVAAGIGNALSRNVSNRLLVVQRPTRKQSMLSHAERAKNVSKAFCCRGSGRLAGQHVAVVDDIITTGATMNELARVLKRAGARRVTALVIARATRSDLVIRKPK